MDSQNRGDDENFKKQSITATTIFTAAVEAVADKISFDIASPDLNE